MNRLQAALAEIGRVLDECDIDWALVGGLAVSARAEPRFTRDVDLAVAVEGDPEAESLVRELRGREHTEPSSRRQPREEATSHGASLEALSSGR